MVLILTKAPAVRAQPRPAAPAAHLLLQAHPAATGLLWSVLLAGSVLSADLQRRLHEGAAHGRTGAYRLLRPSGDLPHGVQLSGLKSGSLPLGG